MFCPKFKTFPPSQSDLRIPTCYFDISQKGLMETIKVWTFVLESQRMSLLHTSSLLFMSLRSSSAEMGISIAPRNPSLVQHRAAVLWGAMASVLATSPSSDGIVCRLPDHLIMVSCKSELPSILGQIFAQLLNVITAVKYFDRCRQIKLQLN